MHRGTPLLDLSSKYICVYHADADPDYNAPRAWVYTPSESDLLVAKHISNLRLLNGQPFEPTSLVTLSWEAIQPYELYVHNDARYQHMYVEQDNTKVFSIMEDSNDWGALIGADHVRVELNRKLPSECLINSMGGMIKKDMYVRMRPGFQVVIRPVRQTDRNDHVWLKYNPGQNPQDWSHVAKQNINNILNAYNEFARQHPE